MSAGGVPLKARGSLLMQRSCDAIVPLCRAANVPGTFVYTPPAGTVLPIGAAETLSVVFTPADSADYTTASKSVSINVVASGGGGPANLVPTSILARDPNTGGWW